MEKKTLRRIVISFLIFLFLLIIFECFTLGGFYINDIKYWMEDSKTEHVVGDFKPYIRFGERWKHITIVPLVFNVHSVKPTNTIFVKYGRYDYERFEYVRFTKFEVRYHSGHVQKFILYDSYIRGRKYEVLNDGSDDKVFILNDEPDNSLFWFKLDRSERFTVIIEGYSKLKISDDEKFFNYTKNYYIRKKRVIQTKTKWFSGRVVR